MDATKKRAEKLQAKGKEVDFKELLRMEPDGDTTNIRNVKSKHWTGCSGRFLHYDKTRKPYSWFHEDIDRSLLDGSLGTRNPAPVISAITKARPGLPEEDIRTRAYLIWLASVKCVVRSATRQLRLKGRLCSSEHSRQRMASSPRSRAAAAIAIEGERYPPHLMATTGR